MMKKRLTAALLAAGLLLAGCAADRGTAPPSGSESGGASQTGTVDHTPEEPLAWEALPAEVQELLRGYGGFFSEATGKAEASGLLLHSGWLSANELTTKDFFWWYRMREWLALPAEEFAARYASPDPDWSGAFFPEEELEAAVDACFSPEYDPAALRRNTGFYAAEYGGYLQPVQGERGGPLEIYGWTADGDNYTVTYEVPDMTRRMTLTARKTDDGFRYLSCLPERAILTEEEAGELVTGVLGQLRIFPEEDGSFHDNGTGVLLLGERWESPAKLGGRELLFWLRCNGFPVESSEDNESVFPAQAADAALAEDFAGYDPSVLRESEFYDAASDSYRIRFVGGRGLGNRWWIPYHSVQPDGVHRLALSGASTDSLCSGVLTFRETGDGGVQFLGWNGSTAIR